MKLERKVAFVTGGSGDIGRSICNKLILGGFNVAIGYKTNEKNTRSIAKKNNTIAIYVDISSRQSIKHAIKKCKTFFGKDIDVLINNAAISQEKQFEKITDEDWDNMLNTNLRGPFMFSQEVIPNMIKKKWGRIVNVVSIGGQWGGYNQAHYAAAKAGLINLTKSLSNIYAKYGITINAISPGLVESKMSKKELRTSLGKRKMKNIPIGRIANPNEIANVVSFLCSNDASYITSQTINVNGGMLS